MNRITALAVLGVLGCKSDVEKILDKHKDKLKPQLDKIAALSPIVAKEPKLTTDRWPVPGVKWPTNVYTDPNGGNALWAWSHQLVDPCSNREATFAKDNTGSDYIILTETQVSTTGDLLGLPGCAVAGKLEQAAGLDEHAVTYLEGVTHVLVLRPEVKQVPELDKAESDASYESYMKTGKGKDVEHFVPGRIAGDALLYELGTGKLVGGFLFDATNSESVEVKGASAGIQEMRFDIAKRLESQIAAKLRM